MVKTEIGGAAAQIEMRGETDKRALHFLVANAVSFLRSDGTDTRSSSWLRKTGPEYWRSFTRGQRGPVMSLGHGVHGQGPSGGVSGKSLECPNLVKNRRRLGSI
jgi:hypothetical protein